MKFKDFEYPAQLNTIEELQERFGKANVSHDHRGGRHAVSVYCPERHRTWAVQLDGLGRALYGPPEAPPVADVVGLFEGFIK